MVESHAESRWTIWLNSLLSSAIAVLALSVIILLQKSQLKTATGTDSNYAQAEKEEALQLELLARSPTFGFDNLIADWAFLGFLQYFGDTPAREQTGYELNDNYLEIVTRLDPYFADVYPFVSVGISFYQGNPDVAIEYLDRGTAVITPDINPNAFNIWRYKAIDQLLLLGDVPGAIKSNEMALKFVKGTEYEYFVPLYQQTIDYLKADPNSIMARFLSWSDIYYRVDDEGVRQRAEQELLAIGAQKKLMEDGQVMFTVPTEKIDQKSQ